MSLHVADVLYTALRERDPERMASCYTTDAHFMDPVFDLYGEQIGRMWKVLCSGADDLDVSYQIVRASDEAALVDWEASYTFPVTGRKVHNKVQARMSLQDGVISVHLDTFSFYRWSRQAFGLSGAALGWTPVFQTKVRDRALRSLG